MPRDTSELTWLERARLDPTLRDFVDAEIARAGIELDTLRYRQGIDKQRVAALSAQLDAARKTITTLRRRLGRGTRLSDGVDGDAA
jgi:hypothetical protein